MKIVAVIFALFVFMAVLVNAEEPPAVENKTPVEQKNVNITDKDGKTLLTFQTYYDKTTGNPVAFFIYDSDGKQIVHYQDKSKLK